MQYFQLKGKKEIYYSLNNVNIELKYLSSGKYGISIKLAGYNDNREIDKNLRKILLDTNGYIEVNANTFVDLIGIKIEVNDVQGTVSTIKTSDIKYSTIDIINYENDYIDLVWTGVTDMKYNKNFKNDVKFNLETKCRVKQTL